MMQKKRKIKVPRNCQFCHEKTSPDFREVGVLSRYMTERARIIGRDRSGVCALHQRSLTSAIKRARHVALLPFVSGL